MRVPSPACGGGLGRGRSQTLHRLLLHHQAIDLDRRARIVRQAAAGGALQLVAFLAAGDLDGAGIDVLAESRDAEMALRVGARHQAGVAALDLGHHLGVGDALAAQAEILGEAEERRARLVLVALVEAGAARPGAARYRERRREVVLDAGQIDDREGGREHRECAGDAHDPKPRILLTTWPTRKLYQTMHATKVVTIARVVARSWESDWRQ